LNAGTSKNGTVAIATITATTSINEPSTTAALKLRHPHGCFIKKSIVVFESFEEVVENSTKKLRQSAWSKLSPQERAACGLVEP